MVAQFAHDFQTLQQNSFVLLANNFSNPQQCPIAYQYLQDQNHLYPINGQGHYSKDIPRHTYNQGVYNQGVSQLERAKRDKEA